VASGGGGKKEKREEFKRKAGYGNNERDGWQSLKGGRQDVHARGVKTDKESQQMSGEGTRGSLLDKCSFISDQGGGKELGSDTMKVSKIGIKWTTFKGKKRKGVRRGGVKTLS